MHADLESVRLPGVQETTEQPSQDALQEDPASGREAALDCPEESLAEAAVALPSAKPGVC